MSNKVRTLTLDRCIWLNGGDVPRGTEMYLSSKGVEPTCRGDVYNDPERQRKVKEILKEAEEIRKSLSKRSASMKHITYEDLKRSEVMEDTERGAQPVSKSGVVLRGQGFDSSIFRHGD